PCPGEERGVGRRAALTRVGPAHPPPFANRAAPVPALAECTVQHACEQGDRGGVRTFGRPAESDDQALLVTALAVPMLAEACEGKPFSSCQRDEFVLGRTVGGKPDECLKAGWNADDQVWTGLFEGGDQQVAAAAVAQSH